jgi:hypothetical protein
MSGETTLCKCFICKSENSELGGKVVSITTFRRHKKRESNWSNSTNIQNLDDTQNLNDTQNFDDIENFDDIQNLTSSDDELLKK